MHSPIIASIAASVAQPQQPRPHSPSHVDFAVEDSEAASVHDADQQQQHQQQQEQQQQEQQQQQPPTKNAKATTPAAFAVAAPEDDAESSMQRGCIPPKMRNKCIIS
jgi:transcription initiation factor TFIID subunit TAF12